MSLYPRRLLAGARSFIPLLWLALAARATAAAPEAPNIVIIHADDLGWSDLGCYGAAHHRSPNLDGLARSGMRFLQAYAAAPACTPSRAGLLTGQYPARLHITGQPSFRTDPPTRQFLPPDFSTALPASVPTIAQRLSTVGYATGCFGKWGFDNEATGSGFAIAKDSGATADAATLTAMAVDFVRQQKSARFFLYLNHHLVHEPLAPKVEPARIARFSGAFQGAGLPNNAAYAAAVEKLDEEVGRLLAVIDAARLSERTLVIFLSDNGGFLGTDREVFTSNAPLREGKSSLYEGGIRVPMIVRWPGVVRRGAICADPVMNLDLVPTLLAAVGVPVGSRVALDGISFLPALRGESMPPRVQYWHWPHYRRAMAGMAASPSSAVRDGGWKLIHFYADDHVELYDLASDPGERRDLASSQSERASALRRQLDAWRSAVGAQPPVSNPAFASPARP